MFDPKVVEVSSMRRDDMRAPARERVSQRALVTASLLAVPTYAGNRPEAARSYGRDGVTRFAR